MKRLLGFVSDVRMRYKLVTDLNFRDFGISIFDGDVFLRDVMVFWVCVIIIWIFYGFSEFVYRSWNEEENVGIVGNYFIVFFKNM